MRWWRNRGDRKGSGKGPPGPEPPPDSGAGGAGGSSVVGAGPSTPSRT